MLDQLFDFIVGFAMLCVPMLIAALVTGIIETRRERRAK